MDDSHPPDPGVPANGQPAADPAAPHAAPPAPTEAVLPPEAPRPLPANDPAPAEPPLPVWPTDLEDVAADDGVEEIVQPQPPPDVPPPPPRLILPWPVPPEYEPLELLARGNVGVVYKAKSRRLNRVVAVLVRGGSGVNAEERARSRIEAEAVAQVVHPNILQTFEIGEVSGCPYVVLELLEARSLAAALKEGEWAPKGRQVPRRAAAFVATLARALHCAHQFGVYHRDLQPTKILLAPDGSPKLGEFGLARRPAARPDPGQPPGAVTVVGNASYLAPEHADPKLGRLGPTADVYTLGTILYELITGKPPFSGPTPLEILRVARTDRPVPPRKLRWGIPRDLQAICLKCLEKEPGRRYASAEALADDLDRFLAGKLVKARPAGVVGRGLWMVRHRPLAAAGAVVGVLAIAAVLGGGWWYSALLLADLADAQDQRQEAVRAQQRDRQTLRAELKAGLKVQPAPIKDLGPEVLPPPKEKVVFVADPGAQKQLRAAQRERDQAEKGRLEAQRRQELAEARNSEAERQRALAEKQRDEFKQQLDQMARRQQAAPGQAPFRQARALLDPLVAALDRPPPADAVPKDDARRNLLEQALAFYQGVIADNKGSPSAARDTASAWRRLGDVQRLLGNLKEAEPAYRQGVELEALAAKGGPDTPAARAELAAAYANFGAVLARLGKAGEAEHCYGQAVDLGQKLVDAAPDNVAYREALAGRLGALGRVQEQNDRPAEAVASCARALDLRLRLAEEHPKDAARREELADAFTAAGTAYAAQGQRKEAEDAFRNAYVLFKKLSDAAPAGDRYAFKLARCTSSLAAVLRERGDQQGAERTARVALAQWQKLARDFPAQAACREGLGHACNQLGLVLLKRAPQEAESAFQQARAVCRKLVAEAPRSAEAHSQLGLALHNLGGLLAGASDLAGAVRLLGEAAVQQQAAVDADPKQLTYRRLLRNDYSWLAEALARQGDHAAAHEAAVRLAAVFPGRWQDSYRAACLLGRCAALAANDRLLPEGARREALRQHGDDSVKLLRRALKDGAKGSVSLSREADLAPLRSRPDFQELLRETTGQEVLPASARGRGDS